jgi:hypothetical protein
VRLILGSSDGHLIGSEDHFNRSGEGGTSEKEAIIAESLMG